MNIRDLVNRIDSLNEESAAPAAITPTHFHKGFLGNMLPLMMTEPGIFWWEGSGNPEGGRGGGGRVIQRWQGNAKNRNSPASVDGVYVNGKPVEFPEGVTWDTYKPQDTPVQAAPGAPDQSSAETERLARQNATAGQADKPGQYLNIDKNSAAKFILLVNKVETAKKTEPAATTTGDAPAADPAAATTGQAGKPAQNLLPVDPKVQALQKAILAKDPSALPKYGADGRMGKETQAALAKYPEIKLQESFSLGIDSALLESFGYQLDEITADQALDITKAVGKEVAPTLATGAAVQAGAKMLGKHIPGINLAFAGKDAYDRFKSGDYTGAGISALSGAAGLVPGIGTAASLGLDAANIARDYKHGEFDALLGRNKQPSSDQAGKPATVPPGGDPKVFALQQQLIAKGAKITADGKMGPQTRAAMSQFKMAMPQESVAESIASLRDRLARLDEKGVFSGAAITGAEALAKSEKEAGNVIKKGAQEFIRSPETGQMIRNPNFAKAELPGAAQVTGDTAMGTAGQKVAQGRADFALDRGRAASKTTQGTVDDMVRGAKPAAGATDQAALKARLQAGNTLSSRTSGGIKDLAKVEQELTAAEKAGKIAPDVMAKIKAFPGGVVAWAKANPKLAGTLLAVLPTLAVLMSGDSKSDPATTTTTQNPATTVPGGQDQKPETDPNAADMATLKALYNTFMAGKGEAGGQDFEPQLADAIKRYEAMVGKTAPADSGAGTKPPSGPVDANGNKLAYDVGNTRSYTGSDQNPNWSAGAAVKESEDELARWLRIARG